ncbi:MAG: helix-turn-helix domain-containing protein [Lachnospiraceae bacterium]|nr:helix-turn-helix domain-containing protein [Lachnospiraceae bacterium]
MDQKKIGLFLRELRNEKNLSQEKLAEEFGVTSRSISRWENGNTMPDISIIIELADFYDVDIREIIHGERKSENMDKELKDTLVTVADYTNNENGKIMQSAVNMAIITSVLFEIITLIIFYFYSLSDNLLLNLAAIVTSFGVLYSGLSVLRLFEMNEKISKKSHKVLGIILVCVALFLMIVVIGNAILKLIHLL